MASSSHRCPPPAVDDRSGNISTRARDYQGSLIQPSAYNCYGLYFLNERGDLGVHADLIVIGSRRSRLVLDPLAVCCYNQDMGRPYDIKRLNEDLKRDLAAMPAPKQRVIGHKATKVHGEAGMTKTERARRQRRTWRADQADS